jgi:hypothetical protein
MRLREQAGIFSKILGDYFLERLVSVVLFGSVARGEETDRSDIDLVVVIKKLPAGRTARQKILEPVYEKFLSLGFTTPVNCHLKTPEEAQKMTVMYLDFPDGAELLHDSNDFFKKIIAQVSQHIQKTGAHRKRWGKFYYWDLRPGGSAEETFDIL